MFMSYAFGTLITFLCNCGIPHNFTTHAIPVSLDADSIVDILGNVTELARLMNDCVHVVFNIIVLFC
jgi:hypothetical protein